MRKTVVLSALMVLMFTAIPLCASDGVFRSVKGKVEYQLPGESWKTASVGTAVPTGAQISTGFRSEATLEIDTAILEIKPLTRMRIDELVEREGLVSTGLFLKVGRVRADVKKLEGLQNEFRLESTVSTAAVRGTSFEYDGVNVRVFTGSVWLANRFNIGTLVSAGGRGSAFGNGPPRGGIGARENELMIVLSPLPAFSGIEGLPSRLPPPLQGLEYGSIAITVNYK
jgi:hypothetical protein